LPAVSKVKKALTQEDLKKLFACEPKTPEQEKAKDFWFFSFACNGANIKDIALLTNKEVNEDTVKFYRAKTINTSKKDLKEIVVYLNDFSKTIIKKYGNLNKEKGEYVFDIISSKQSEAVKHKNIKNFTKFINQNLKKLAQSNGITKDISTYWARHSFATSAIRNGATMEFVMEALSHNNMKTTKGYFAGFEDKDKKEFMKNLMDF
jgi:integrase/recombinase XerD